MSCHMMCTKFEWANEDAYRLLSAHLHDRNVHYFQDLKKYFDSCGGQISMKTVQVCITFIYQTSTVIHVEWYFLLSPSIISC